MGPGWAVLSTYSSTRALWNSDVQGGLGHSRFQGLGQGRSRLPPRKSGGQGRRLVQHRSGATRGKGRGGQVGIPETSGSSTGKRAFRSTGAGSGAGVQAGVTGTTLETQVL